MPCRGHSIELIPLYEKYRDRGFTVVGVAREYDGLDDMRLAIEKDGYPWVQLYDLDNAEGVWDLYGLSTAGGGIFLIDREGRIVEKVADIESVRNYLEEHLGR
ncbi:MAG TPA: TlpA family protein disulfide reductase [Candidatus Alistipes intestinipullorum]|nr:TlpA family protein disulfide reductase [Candidatus Alistipes intestinipullorum]